jgi:glutamate synthase (NADPH/NADH) large chain
MLGIPLPPGGSDSQDLNRTLEGLIRRFGLTLFEAMEMVFPPIVTETERMAPELASMYDFFRRFLTASAQGPAAIIARHRDACIFSVDAMGLRPLWFGETDKDTDPPESVSFPGSPTLPLAPARLWPAPVPGRKASSTPGAAAGTRPLSPPDFFGGSQPIADQAPPVPAPRPWERLRPQRRPLTDNLLAALVEGRCTNLRPPAPSRSPLGYDGRWRPSPSAGEPSDYFKEQVAVVTNPAIDRAETGLLHPRHLGARPNLRGPARAVRLGCC